MRGEMPMPIPTHNAHAHAQHKINELLAAFEKKSQRPKKIRKNFSWGKNPNLNATTTTFELRLAETGNSIYDNRTEGIFHIQLG